MLSDDWAPWEVEILTRELPNKDVSYSAIGKMVGRSRNAVCAKVHRMGLSRGRPAVQIVKRPTAMPPLPPSSDVRRILARHRAETTTRELVSLTDLTDSQCHFPIGDPKVDKDRWGHPKVYCGEPAVPGLSYCASCVSRVYQPPEVQRAKQRVRPIARVYVPA